MAKIVEVTAFDGKKWLINTALKAYHKYCRWCGAKMDGGNEE